VPRFKSYGSWLQLTYVMNLGNFCPLEKNCHILTPIPKFEFRNKIYDNLFNNKTRVLTRNLLVN
jgi:hypothetical protein